MTLPSYPNEIPTLTSVPSWAYLNIEAIISPSSNAFDANVLFKGDQRHMGFTTGSRSCGSTATEATTTATEAQNTFSSGVAIPTTSTSQRSSGVNAGAIAGGVVGGVAFLAIVAVICYWYSLRRKRRNDETEVNMVEPHFPPNPTTPYNTAMASGSVMRETPGHRSQQGSITSLNTYSPPITDRTYSSNYFSSPTSPATSAAYTTFDPAPNIYVMWRQFGSRTIKGQQGPCELAAKKDEACSRGDDLRPFLSNDLHIPPQLHLGNDTSSWCQSKEAPKWDSWTAGCKKPLDIRLHPAVGNLLKFPVEALADISQIEPPSQHKVPPESRPPTPSRVVTTATVTTPPQTEVNGALGVSSTHTSRSSARQQIVAVVSSSSSSAHKASISSLSRSSHVPTLSPTPSQPKNGPFAPETGRSSSTSLDRTSTATPSSSSTVLQSTDGTIKTQWMIAGVGGASTLLLRSMHVCTTRREGAMGATKAVAAAWQEEGVGWLK
ncbi:hypothetical protein EYR38_004209 [Pleurotus pulmonarius]|nr:hypothetical protein EYR38_004209 [Pleurotus pulmonarius]